MHSHSGLMLLILSSIGNVVFESESLCFSKISFCAARCGLLITKFVGSELLNQMFPLINPNHFAQM